MKNSIKKNYIYNLIYQVVIIIIPLITTPYLSRVLGAEAIGIYSYTLSITTYFILFGSLGVAMYGQREIAYVQGDKIKRSKVFFEILLMRFITLGVSILLFYFMFVRQGEYKTYYKILLLEIIANSIDISWLFQGLEEFKKIVMRNTLVKIISILFIFLLVKNTSDIYIYFIIYVMSNFFGNISLWIYLPKYVQKIKIKDLNVFKHLKPTLLLFIPQVAVQIYTVLDKTMIGSIVEDKAEVGFYEQAQKIIKLLITITTSLGTVMIPRMANTFAKGEKEQLKVYLKRSFNFVFFLAFPLILGMISIINKFVPLYYGDGFEKVTYLICIISPIVLAIGLSNVTGTQYLLPTRQQKYYTISVTVGALVNFFLNIILIHYYNSIGASIATVIAEMTVTIIQFYLVRKQINIKDIIKLSKNYIIASIIMFIVSVCIGLIIINTVISILIQVIISMLIYFAILLIMKDELILEIIRIIEHKVKEYNGKKRNI